VENEQRKPRGGRPKQKADTEPLKLRVDRATWKILEELEAYGRLGLTKQDIVLHVLRKWLWDNESRLKAGIALKDSPLTGGPPKPE